MLKEDKPLRDSLIRRDWERGKIRIENDDKTEIIRVEKPVVKEKTRREEPPFIFHEKDEQGKPIEKTKLEKEIGEILTKTEVSLILDTYDDIFSDFDPRPYSIRGLSDDFIVEAKKALKETKPGEFELKFLIPEAQRRPGQEPLIKKRLKEYSKNQLTTLEKETKTIRRNGLKRVAIGMVLMVSAGLLYTLELGISNWVHLLVIPVEPAGWFFVWEGFERIFNYTKEKKPDMEFYKKLNKAEITFITF
jgi:hypothetical protein